MADSTVNEWVDIKFPDEWETISTPDVKQTTPEKRGIVPEIAAGVGRAFLNTGAGVVSLLERPAKFVGEFASALAGPEQMRSFTETDREYNKLPQIRENIQAQTEALHPTRGGAGGWALNVLAEGVPQLGIMLSTGQYSSAVPFLLQFGSAGEQYYQTAKKNGAKEEDALRDYALGGLVEGALEYWGVNKLMGLKETGKGSVKLLTSQISKKLWKQAGGNVKNITGDMLKSAIVEGLQEGSQGAGGFTVQALPGGGDVPRKADGSPDYTEMLKQVGQQTAGGALVGSLAPMIQGGGTGPTQTVPQTPEPVTQTQPSNIGVIQTPVDITEKLNTELASSLKLQKKARKELSVTYSKERGRRAAAATEKLNELLAKGMSETEAQAEIKSIFGGKLAPEDSQIMKEALPKLSDVEWDAAQRKAIDLFPEANKAYTRLKASDAINKMREGKILQNAEIELMAKVFGDKTSKLLRKQQPFSDRILYNIYDIGGLSKTLVAGGDLSYSFNQLLPTLWRSPRVWARSVSRGARTFFAKDIDAKLKKYQDAILDSKYYEEAVEHKMPFTDMGEGASATVREESFPSRAGSMWPLVKRGNAAVVVMSNTARMGLYELMRDQMNTNPKKFPPTNARLDKLTSVIGDYTGRAKLPGGQAVANLSSFANHVTFSTRLNLARVKNVGTLFHAIDSDPFIRRQGLQALAQGFAIMGAIGLLGKMMGYDISLEPKSADFLKFKKGNKRKDVTAGYGAILRFIARMATSETTTQAGETKQIPRTDIVAQFAKSKRSPLIGLISMLYTGKDFAGKPIEGVGGWTKEMSNQFLYMWVQDAIESFKENNKTMNTIEALGMAIPDTAESWVGVGVQIYEPSVRTGVQVTKNQYAQDKYSKNWNELNPLQQRQLTREHKQEFEEAERQVKVEGAKEKDYEFMSRMAEQEREAGDNALKSLSKEAKGELSKLGITLLLSQSVEKYQLNNDDYEKYQKLIGQEVKTPLEQLLSSPLWEHYSDKRKEEKIKRIINRAKETAGNKIIREVYRQ